MHYLSAFRDFFLKKLPTQSGTTTSRVAVEKIILQYTNNTTTTGFQIWGRSQGGLDSNQGIVKYVFN